MNSGTGIQICDKVNLSRPANNVDQSPGGAVIVASPTPPIFCHSSSWKDRQFLAVFYLVLAGQAVYFVPMYPVLLQLPDPFYDGLKEAYLFDPFTEAWERLPDLQGGRWYPTLIRFADDHVLTLSIGLSPAERKPQNKVSTSHNRKEGSNVTKITPVRA